MISLSLQHGQLCNAGKGVATLCITWKTKRKRTRIWTKDWFRNVSQWPQEGMCLVKKQQATHMAARISEISIAKATIYLCSFNWGWRHEWRHSWQNFQELCVVHSSVLQSYWQGFPSENVNLSQWRCWWVASPRDSKGKPHTCSPAGKYVRSSRRSYFTRQYSLQATRSITLMLSLISCQRCASLQLKITVDKLSFKYQTCWQRLLTNQLNKPSLVRDVARTNAQQLCSQMEQSPWLNRSNIFLVTDINLEPRL